jgi:hypothetical protein
MAAMELHASMADISAPNLEENMALADVSLMNRGVPGYGWVFLAVAGGSLPFAGIVRERRVEELREWLIEATCSGLQEFRRFAKGLTVDLSAVKAALLYEWSNGQVEGQVHRLKMIKRQMYGRAKLSLQSLS